jgi:hypothetical protein
MEVTSTTPTADAEGGKKKKEKRTVDPNKPK